MKSPHPKWDVKKKTWSWTEIWFHFFSVHKLFLTWHLEVTVDEKDMRCCQGNPSTECLLGKKYINKDKPKY